MGGRHTQVHVSKRESGREKFTITFSIRLSLVTISCRLLITEGSYMQLRFQKITVEFDLMKNSHRFRDKCPSKL